MVLDSGDGVSHAVPVYEGFAVPSSIRRIDVAGRDITEYLQLLLRKSGYVFHTSAEKEVVRMIKEKTSYVAADPKKEEKEWASTGGRAEGKTVEYTLPDGNKVKVRHHTSTIPTPSVRGSKFVGVLSGRLRAFPRPRNPLRPRDNRPRIPRHPPNRRRCHHPHRHGPT